MDRLLEHEKFKNAAEMLQQKRMIEENVWSNPQMKAFLSEDDDPGVCATLFDLVKAFGEVLERTKNRPVYEVASEDVSVADMILYLKSVFLAAGDDEPVFIMQIFEQQRSRRAMIALFLAVLEMVKMQAVEVCQKDLFGEIALRRQKQFDTVFASAAARIRRSRRTTRNQRRAWTTTHTESTPQETVSADELLGPARRRAAALSSSDAQLKAVLEAIVYVTEEPLSADRLPVRSANRASASRSCSKIWWRNSTGRNTA